MSDHRSASAGPDPEDPVFAVLSDVFTTELGEPVEGYFEPLSEESVTEYHERLDDGEPTHAAAAARLHQLFAG
jgi:hypothetical protein